MADEKVNTGISTSVSVVVWLFLAFALTRILPDVAGVIIILVIAAASLGSFFYRPVHTVISVSFICYLIMISLHCVAVYSKDRLQLVIFPRKKKLA